MPTPIKSPPTPPGGIRANLPESIINKLGDMGQTDIEVLRQSQKYSGNSEVQKTLALAGHQALTRDAVKENPELAPVFAALVPLYSAAKAAHILPEDENTTPASRDEMLAGYKGILQGLGMHTDDTNAATTPTELLAALTPVASN